jgi:hypothetical protein
LTWNEMDLTRWILRSLSSASQVSSSDMKVLA